LEIAGWPQAAGVEFHGGGAAQHGSATPNGSRSAACPSNRNAPKKLARQREQSQRAAFPESTQTAPRIGIGNLQGQGKFWAARTTLVSVLNESIVLSERWTILMRERMRHKPQPTEEDAVTASHAPAGSASNAAGRARWPDLEALIALRTTRVVLGAVHLNHDARRDRWRNLRSLCHRCDMLHDRPYHLAQHWITYRLCYALGDLFLGRYQRGLAPLQQG